MKTRSYILILAFLLTSVFLRSQELADYLIPVPKKIEQREGVFNPNFGRIIVPDVRGNSAILKMAGELQSLLSEVDIETSVAAKSAKGEMPLLWINIAPVLSPQAYKIAINADQILLEGGDEAGLFYALQTFKQIVRYAKSEEAALPLVTIEDSPDIKRRGIMLDVSRNKVPTMETLKKLVDLFSGWKINELQLYTENTFAYQNHKVVWEGFSPMTAGDILELDGYCRERFVDLVPNQTSFGHMNQWLRHDQYKHLAELTGPNSGHVMSPVVPATLDLMRELYAELLPNFSSRYFNIDCDETQSLGHGRSKEIVEEKGKGRVYLDYLLKLKDEIDKYGRTTQFWGDIILLHPELIPEIPKDMIALVWGYSAGYPFDYNCQKFKEAGCPFYVCPGTSSWNSLVGRNQNAYANLRNAAKNGIKHGAMGYLNTDWGDGGHWQPLSVSYPTYLFGAAVSWGFEANADINIGKLVSRYIFNDTSEISGQALVEIGNAYPDKTEANSNLFHRLIRSSGGTKIPEDITKENLQETIRILDENLEHLTNAPISNEDSEIIKAEMTLAVNFARLACKIGIARLDIPDNDLSKVEPEKREALSEELKKLVEEHKKLWIIRNRPGGLHISAGNFERALSELGK